jgi:DNA-binding IclR family transcriptional regulator
MGKVLLSEFSDEQIDTLYPNERLQPLTRKTITSKKVLKRELEQIRETGLSYSDGGTYEGLFGIATLIRNANGKGIAAVSINVPSIKSNSIDKEKLGVLIKMGANLISYRLGYENMVDPVRNIREITSWWERNQSVSDS